MDVATSSSVKGDDTDNYSPWRAWNGRSTRGFGGFFSSKFEMEPWLKFKLKPVAMEGLTIINTIKVWYTYSGCSH